MRDVVKGATDMRVHVVYAHPSPTSFAAAIHRQVVDSLTAVGHEVDDLDLYAENFQPALTREEREVHYKAGPNLGTVDTYVERLRAAEALVLCFPTWWYGMPAILKGWFDRVWLPGVAFHNPPEGGAIRRGLTNIRKLAVVTTYNAPWWFIRLYMQEPGKKVLMRGVTRLIAPRARTQFIAHYDMLRSTDASRKRFLERVHRAFKSF
jgi:putative NADPH-quinone reductase